MVPLQSPSECRSSSSVKLSETIVRPIYYVFHLNTKPVLQIMKRFIDERHNSNMVVFLCGWCNENLFVHHHMRAVCFCTPVPIHDRKYRGLLVIPVSLRGLVLEYVKVIHSEITNSYKGTRTHCLFRLPVLPPLPRSNENVHG